MKKYKRVVDRHMHVHGDIDLEKKIIRVNPRKGDLLNTVVHEELHREHPTKPEQWIRKKAKKKESDLTVSQAMELLKRYKKGSK